jgi:hypothetical protein
MRCYKKYNKLWVQVRNNKGGENRLYPIPETAEGLTLKYVGEGEAFTYEPTVAVVVEQTVVDRQKAKDARKPMKPFLDWSRMINKLSDGWVMNETREQFGTFKLNGWRGQYDYGVPSDIADFNWYGGLDWKAGDEAIMAYQDYGAMLDMFEQVQNRYGVTRIMLSVPNHPKNDEEIVQLYQNAITPKTKVILVSHMINISGQILPIRKICDMAHEKGVQVIVDGAHAFAHFKYKIEDLNCDYYAAALHKWLSTPLGAGMLYVRKDNIKKVWPLLADGEKDLNKINRLNHTGTHPVHTDLTINDSIDYYEMIGPERKEARLRYLQNYWTS